MIGSWQRFRPDASWNTRAPSPTALVFPEFWVQEPIDGKPAGTANGIHISFLATSRQQVDEFFSVACALGASDDGAPGWRPEYGDAYYGCFVRDLDGHKIEAMFWDEEKAGN